MNRVSLNPATAKMCLKLHVYIHVHTHHHHIMVLLLYWIHSSSLAGGEAPSPPVLLTSPRTSFVQWLSDPALDCDVTGNPEPLITWYKDGVEMRGATQRRLSVVEVDFLDRAAYHCTAHNSLGNVTSDVAYLNIRGLTHTHTHILYLADIY